MQGMIVGKRSIRKPRQRWEEDITNIFGMMATASRLAENRHRFHRHLGSERKEGNLYFGKYNIIYKMKYSTILSALETITKTAMRSLS